MQNKPEIKSNQMFFKKCNQLTFNGPRIKDDAVQHLNPYLHVCPLNIDSVKQKLMQCEIFICLSGRPIYFENRKEHSKSFKSIPIYSVCILTYGLCNNKPELLKRKNIIRINFFRNVIHCAIFSKTFTPNWQMSN